MARKSKTKPKTTRNWHEATHDLLASLAKKSGKKTVACVFSKTGDLLFRAGRETADPTILGALVTAGESLRIQLNVVLKQKAEWLQFGEGSSGYWFVGHKDWILFVSGADWKPVWMNIFKQLSKKKSSKSGTSEALEGLAPGAVDAALNP